MEEKLVHYRQLNCKAKHCSIKLILFVVYINYVSAPFKCDDKSITLLMSPSYTPAVQQHISFYYSLRITTIHLQYYTITPAASPPTKLRSWLSFWQTIKLQVQQAVSRSDKMKLSSALHIWKNSLVSGTRKHGQLFLVLYTWPATYPCKEKSSYIKRHKTLTRIPRVYPWPLHTCFVCVRADSI